MSQPIIQVDAFTEAAFGGNPAAVCIMAGPREDAWMQAVAKEMNLSETAFLHLEDSGYRLRWFTPAVEVSLCGHATLAAAHVLYEDGHLEPNETAMFHTASGALAAIRDGEWIRMDFPANLAQPAEAPAGMAEALGADTAAVSRNEFDYLVEVPSAWDVRNLQPDFRALGRLPVRGLIVTARADSGEYDFISRFFAPQAGIDEDPVTGSAHCVLGPYWAAKLGKLDLTGYQASGRGGVVRVEIHGDRVHLLGKAVTVMRGALTV